ncbi:MAG: tyrosine--tRNA ligase [Alphaproteobacteria bacterium]|nr:tyrosine--tRNA ligase [Alphaproteobacteria bacterium]
MDGLIYVKENIVYDNGNNYTLKSSFLQELDSRDFLYQCTNIEALDNIFNNNENVTFYLGYDPTAKSLHVGHLLWIRLVKKLHDAGHKPIILIGGATGKIGDPTWKETQRKMLDYNTILDNIASINNKLMSIFCNNIQDNSITIVNNADWLSKLNYMDFLREFGPLFSVNKMLAMDSVSSRLQRQQHLSFLEFNYMLLQAYDFLYLFENYNCTLQIGGQDQWSNIISGVDLIRRKKEQEAYGLSIPLLLTSDGKKMGKSESGTVWLDENMLSPLDFWQYWRNVDDKDVVKLLKLFTDLSIDEIEKYDDYIGSKEINEGKIILADAVTSFVHPTANLEDIKLAASGKTISDAMEIVKLDEPLSLDKALVKAGLSESATQAKQLISGNGVRIDDIVINDYKYVIDRLCVVSVGKKKFKKFVI